MATDTASEASTALARPAAGEAAGPAAVLLDALGTMLRLEPPAPRLRAALRAHAGLDVPPELAAEAVRAEIAYYRAHLDEGRDRAGLDRLREACATVVRDALGPHAAGADLGAILAALLEAIRFEPFPDVPAALRELRAAGHRLVVVSNWDVSLHEALADTGLDALVDAAVSSAELGVAKPDPRIFRHALVLAGASPERAVHVGDSLRADVEGARALGLRAVLVRREGEEDDGPPPPGVPLITSFAPLPALLA